MRTGLLGMTALAVIASGPAWAGPAEICANAGYRVGSAAFEMCVARLTQDDPLAALAPAGEADGAQGEPPLDLLETPVIGLEPERGKAMSAPFEPPRRDGELPPSTPVAGFGSQPPSPPPPSSAPPPSPSPSPSAPSGITFPTAPTPPTFPSFMSPSWSWGD